MATGFSNVHSCGNLDRQVKGLEFEWNRGSHEHELEKVTSYSICARTIPTAPALAMAAASSSSSSLLPRPSPPALTSPRQRRCLSISLRKHCSFSSTVSARARARMFSVCLSRDLPCKFCNVRPSIQARALLDETRSQEAADTPMDLSFQFPAPLISFVQDNEQNVSPLHTQNSSKDSLRLHSVSVFPLLAIAALPGAGTVADLFKPIAELVRSSGLPDWLVHWGHPGNMAVVLFAMGGYGSYLGWQIRLADDMEVKTKAKNLHPKLLSGMFFFFTLGATGGVLSLLTSGKPIFESPHAVTGLSGLALLTIQTALTRFFESNPSLRGVHGVLGSGIMLLFLVHAAFGLQLGFSYS